MTQRVGELFTEAKKLPEQERGELIERLLDTFDEDAENDVEAAWSAEIQQRIQELANGDVQAVPWPEARRLILDDTDDADSP